MTSTDHPTTPGHYWARWHTPAPGTQDDGECCDGVRWEVVQVFPDVGDRPMLVFVPGVTQTQPLGNFEWGAQVRRETSGWPLDPSHRFWIGDADGDMFDDCGDWSGTAVTVEIRTTEEAQAVTDYFLRGAA